jgi:exosortase D (VPLPA-CTERM-specific)
LLTAVLLLCAMVAAFWDGLSYMVGKWGGDEYSYAYLVPPIAAWLVWRKRYALAAAEPRGSWAGVAVVVLGLLLGVFGELSTIYTVIHYAFIFTLWGVALAWLGWRGAKVIAAPLAYLLFMVPLPTFLYQGLSANLQLISSSIGVEIIRLVGVSVFLEGNVIDLGVYKLQVVEACSGLRYLFPLASFGFLCACLFRGPWWARLVLFSSTLPITVLINSIRIGVTGILVNGLGIEAAEGFQHDFEGWIIFVVAVGVLFALMWILARAAGQNGSLRDLLGFEERSSNARHRSVEAVVPASGTALLRGTRHHRGRRDCGLGDA